VQCQESRMFSVSDLYHTPLTTRHLYWPVIPPCSVPARVCSLLCIVCLSASVAESLFSKHRSTKVLRVSEVVVHSQHRIYGLAASPVAEARGCRGCAQRRIGRVSKERLFILDLLWCNHSCISGETALRIQHDVSRHHTKTSKPSHPPRRFFDFRDNFVFPWV